MQAMEERVSQNSRETWVLVAQVLYSFTQANKLLQCSDTADLVVA